MIIIFFLFFMWNGIFLIDILAMILIKYTIIGFD